jgi:hypothetical protein
MLKRLARRYALLLCTFVATALIAAPVAWAVGWTTIGFAEIQLNHQPNFAVGTSSAVYSSSMRLYVSTHSCNSVNFWMSYHYSDGSIYARSDYLKICTAAESPAYWNVSGGNKWDHCAEAFPEPSDPYSTCQRYSTT